jgi:hypothetical protein
MDRFRINYKKQFKIVSRQSLKGWWEGWRIRRRKRIRERFEIQKNRIWIAREGIGYLTQKGNRKYLKITCYIFFILKNKINKNLFFK